MKNIRSRIVVGCAVLLMYAACAAGASQWSLKQCIDHALEQNIRIKGYYLETAWFQKRYQQSRAELLPEVNGYANQDFRFGRSIDPYTNGYREQNVVSNGFLLSGRVTLFDGMRGIRTIDRNEIDLAASQKGEAQLKNEVTLQVVDAYLSAIYNQEMIDAAVRQLEVTKLQIDRTQVLVDAGSVAQGNLFELSALAAQEEVGLLRAQNRKSISMLALKQLLELDTVAEFAIAPPQLPEIADADLQAVLPDLYRSALALPEVLRGELGIKSAALNLKIEKTKRLPTLTFDASVGTGYSGSYKKYRQVTGNPSRIGYLGADPSQLVYAPSIRTEEIDYPFSDQFRDNANTRLSLQLNVPIFSRMQIASAISNAEMTIEKKALEYQNVKKEVLRNVQVAYYDARAALLEYRGNIRAVEAGRESFRYIEEKFNVGMVSSVDYHNGKNLLSKAESDLLQSRYNFYLKKTVLEILCGKTITID